MAKLKLDEDQRRTLESSLVEVNELIEQGEAALNRDLLEESDIAPLRKQRNRIVGMLEIF